MKQRDCGDSPHKPKNITKEKTNMITDPYFTDPEGNISTNPDGSITYGFSVNPPKPISYEDRVKRALEYLEKHGTTEDERVVIRILEGEKC